MSAAADDIRELLEKRIAALRRHDAQGANAALDSAIVAFEVAGPLQLPAAQATDVAATQAWLDSFDDGPFVTMEQLVIHADPTLAFCHSLNRVQGRDIDGRKVDVKLRSTLGLQRTEKGWTIIHGHTSLPR